MKLKYLSLFILLHLAGIHLAAQFPRFKALAFYSEDVERAHVEFARDAISFFEDLTIGDGFVFEVTQGSGGLFGDTSVERFSKDRGTTEGLPELHGRGGRLVRISFCRL